MHTCFISFGSNVFPEENIIKALELIKKEERILLKKASSFYKTSAIGVKDQDDFYNGVCEVETSFNPRELKIFFKRLEQRLGREQKDKKTYEEKFGPRTIDIDILLFDDIVVDDEDLHIPDNDICERIFIAKGLYELKRDLIIPGLNIPIKDIVENFDSHHELISITCPELCLLDGFTEKVQSIV